MSPILSSRPVIPHIRTSCSKCNIPLEFPVPKPNPPPSTLLQVRCFECQNVFNHAFYPGQLPQNSVDAGPSKHSVSGPTRRSRKIGTDERPLETGYYDLLGVPVDATTDDIKKAYRKSSPRCLLLLLFIFTIYKGRLAIKFHPDKNRDDPNAEDRFKEIAIAYQTLTDPVLRKKYNEFGPKESAPEGGYVDPEEVFGAIFGGERFIPIIGEISLAKDMKSALQDEDNSENIPRDAKGREVLSPEEKAKREEKARKVSAEVFKVGFVISPNLFRLVQRAAVRKQRIDKLVGALERKLSIFTESANGPDDSQVKASWKAISHLEAQCVVEQNF